ncbi:MAG: carboxypeptidase regulatory-like domain-containing protein [Acidobacteria bacterium]|nr:carboxypeptidase regulatory-like domain-containing protein [Acidobacteriota bacterium]
MLLKRDRIDGLRVATPCPMKWDELRGDDRVRFCDSCNLHVYNISELSRREAERLIKSTEGRFCSRLHRRADGTVITKDCPVGLRALRLRAAKVAGAAVTALFSLCVSIFGQNSAPGEKSGASGKAVLMQQATTGQMTGQTTGELSGVVTDPNGAVVSGTTITLINETTGKLRETTSNDEGVYRFSSLEPGTYTIMAAATGFEVRTHQHVPLQAGVVNEALIDLPVLTTSEVLVGVTMEMDEYNSMDYTMGLKTTFSTRKITSLPF